MRAPFGFDSDDVRGYAHSRAGQRRGIIAEKLDLPYEETDSWPKTRVDYYFHRMQGTGARREEQREEQREKYADEHDLDGVGAGQDGYEPGAADRPDSVPEKVWEHMPADQKRRQLEGHGGANVDEYERHLDIWDQIEDERT